MNHQGRPPILGSGVGLRVPHLRDFLTGVAQVPVLEATTENYLAIDGQPYRNLRAIAERIPVILHGVTLGLGGPDKPDDGLVRRIAQLADDINAPWVSDHCSWGRHRSHHLHDLLPIPYTDDILACMVGRLRRVQDRIGRPFAIENPSSYLTFVAGQMPEVEFLARLVEESECWLLLDVNNIYVSACNHGFSVAEYMDAVPWRRVIEIHVAGHTVEADGFRLDTHDQEVCSSVWEIYREAQRRSGGVTAIHERDGRIPPLHELMEVWDHAEPPAVTA